MPGIIIRPDSITTDEHWDGTLAGGDTALMDDSDESYVYRYFPDDIGGSGSYSSIALRAHFPAVGTVDGGATFGTLRVRAKGDPGQQLAATLARENLTTIQTLVFDLTTEPAWYDLPVADATTLLAAAQGTGGGLVLLPQPNPQETMQGFTLYEVILALGADLPPTTVVPECDGCSKRIEPTTVYREFDDDLGTIWNAPDVPEALMEDGTSTEYLGAFLAPTGLPATATMVQVHMIAHGVADGDLAVQVDIFGRATGGSGGSDPLRAGASSPDIVVPGDDVVREYVMTVTPDDMWSLTWADLMEQMNGSPPAAIEFYAFGSPDGWQLWIQQAWVTACFPCRGRPPLRKFPRSDGLAMSSTPRVGGPTRSTQSSLRRAGGTYY